MAEAKKKSRAAAAAKGKNAAKKKAAPAASKGQAEKDHAERSARGSKGTKKVQRQAAPVPASRKMPGPKVLQELFDVYNGKADDAKSRQGKARQYLGEELKEIGIDKVSFAMENKLEKIGNEDPNRLMVILENFDHLRKVRKLDDLAGPSMFAAREGAAGGEEGSDEGGEDDETTEVPQAAASGGEVVPLH